MQRERSRDSPFAASSGCSRSRTLIRLESSGINTRRIKFDRAVRPFAARTPPRYLPYRSVRARNETGHKWTPRCGSLLFGEISPDRRSTARRRTRLSYVPNFIGGAVVEGRKKKKRTGVKCADGVLVLYELCQRKQK